MKTEVWCKGDYSRIPPIKRGVLVWRGDLSAIPPKDSYIVLHDGFCSERVIDTHLQLHDCSLIVEIRADYSGEYTKRAIELGLIDSDPNAEHAHTNDEK